jgi:hypothetical protein
MQAELEVNKNGKPKSFYLTYVRPALVQMVRPRRKSFWDVSLDDELDPSLSTTAISAGIAISRNIVGIVFLMIGQALLILLPMLYVVQIVFVAPGGLPGVIGRQLADVCLHGGSCDIQLLLASYAFAVIMSVNIVGLLFHGLLSGIGYFDQSNGEDEVLALAVIDDRIVTLRGELISAGVLKEKPDDEAAV